MSKHNNAFRKQAFRNLNSAANSGVRAADKAAAGLGRWMVTDHSGVQFYVPKGLGFFGTIRHLLMQLFLAVFGAVVAGILMFLLVAYGIPALIVGHF
jgi:hypothetical protein